LKTRYSLIALGALMALSQAAMAQRGSSGHANVIYWQAPSILNPYLSTGTKDVESASLVLEPLIRFNEKGEMVPFLAAEVPTVANGGFCGRLQDHHLQAAPRPQVVGRHAVHRLRRPVHLRVLHRHQGLRQDQHLRAGRQGRRGGPEHGAHHVQGCQALPV
jgi:hypothetical protein